MANTYKNIVITPNIGNTADPRIQFSGGNTTVNTDINLYVYPDSNGTLSFEGSAGQLFSITNDLTGSLFSVNDVSGIPLIEVNVTSQQITFGEFYGNVGIGKAASTSSIYKLDVNGTVNASNYLINTFPVAALSYANGVANSANAYAVTVGAASNSWANTLSTIDRTIANAAANSSNAYAVAVGQAGNNYTNQVGAASNTWANTVASRAGVIANAAFDKANTSGPKSEWIIKNTNYTANVGDKIYCNTLAGFIKITLPASPGTGNNVFVASGYNASNANVTIERNGSTIMGLSENLVITETNISVDFVYDGSSWRIA